MAKKQVGRKKKYNVEMIEKVKEHAKKGLIDSQLASILGISVQTLYNYRAEYPEFDKAVTESKLQADAIIELAAFERAKGYEVEEVETITDEDGNVIRTKRTKKHIPAEARLIQFWLQNRKPDEWKDKKEVEMNGGFEIEVNLFGDESDEE